MSCSQICKVQGSRGFRRGFRRGWVQAVLSIPPHPLVLLDSEEVSFSGRCGVKGGRMAGGHSRLPPLADGVQGRHRPPSVTPHP